MTNAISASVSLITAAISNSSASSATASSSSSSLVQLANGEYTAASVDSDPTDASKLGLVKQKDGNYGVTSANQVAPPSQSSTALSSGVRAVLSTLTLGGS